MRGCRSHPHVAERAHGVRFVSKASAGTGCAGRRAAGGDAAGGWPRLPALRTPIPPSKSSSCSNWNSAAMIRQLERAANSVAGGAEATATTLSTIRQRTDALTGRTSAAQDYRDHLLAGRRQVHPFGGRHRLAGSRRQQARRSGRRRRPGSQPQCGSAQGVLGRDRQCRQPDRADRQADHAARAQLDHRGGAGRRRRARLRRGRHRGQGAGGADPGRHRGDHAKDRRAAEGCRRLGRCRAPDLAGDRGDPPGFRKRQRRGGRAERRPPARCPTTPPPHRISSFRSATAPPRSTARPRKPKPMASASPTPARPSPCSRKSSRPAARCCWARTSATTSASSERLPCNLKIEIQTARGPIAAAVYEISMEGILIGGPDAETAAAEPNPRCHDGEHRRLPDSHRRAVQSGRAGAVRGAGRRA